MTRRLALLLLLLLAAAVIVLLTLEPRRDQPVPSPPPASEAPPPPATELPKDDVPPPPAPDVEPERIVAWYEGDDGRLHGESKEIVGGLEPLPRLRATLEALLAGPGYPLLVRNFPRETSLATVYLGPPGYVTVDLDFPSGQLTGLGTHQEWMALQSLIATVLGVAPEGTRGVFVTVRGQTRETFGGHIDLAEPLRLDLELMSDDQPLPVAPPNQES